MKNNRYYQIDFIRSVAIIVIMITHTLSFHRSDKLVFFIWNYLHFVVVILVFCSGYVLYFKYRDYFKTIPITLAWYRKRIGRLVMPFYYYLLIHYSLWYLFPDLFGGWGLKKNLNFIVQSITFTGGVDFNWFPLLFLQLTILFPIIVLSLKKKMLVITLIVLSALSAIYIATIGYQGGSYRYIMWLPWMLIVFFSLFSKVKDRENIEENKITKRYLITGVLFFCMFLFSWNYFVPAGKELVLTQHKYPPDLIYLLYGSAISCLLLALSRLNFLYLPGLQRIYHYIGKRSYQLFFIHYIVLDLILKLTKNLQFSGKPLLQTIAVICISLLITIIVRYFENQFNRK